MAAPHLSELNVGDVVATETIEFSRADLVRYAGASGDFNPIHWNERFAREVGLDGVIAHGMLTMAAAVTVVSTWLGDPGRIIDYGTRFTKPVPVDDAASGSPESPTQNLLVTATVGVLDAEASTARIDLAATAGEAKVLGRAQVVVRLDA